MYSSIRDHSQKNFGVDFQFHIRWQQFQAGLTMSGEGFNSNNNVGAHICYGYRKETKTKNLAIFVGGSYNNGVLTINDSIGQVKDAKYYKGMGMYISAQGIAKITYDFGLGGELFSELSTSQIIFGFKIIAFFSGAYMGPKKVVNPNVRLESSQ